MSACLKLEDEGISRMKSMLPDRLRLVVVALIYPIVHYFVRYGYLLARTIHVAVTPTRCDLPELLPG